MNSYREGKSARPLPISTPKTAEGAVTGDSKHVYVAEIDHIVELDPSAANFAPRRLVLSVGLFDAKKGNCVISGMASNGRELFVADSRENLIRVASLGRIPTYHTSHAPNDGIVVAPAPVAAPSGDARFAPALVYQTQRVGEINKYTIPGFAPGTQFTLRCHLAEFVERPANIDARHKTLRINNTPVVVADLAGGVLKPVVKDFPGVAANSKGEVVLRFETFGPGVCGFEILGPKQERLFAVNCGGPSVGDFKGENPELVDRSFAFERPGPMAVDSRGDLWIIQRSGEFPMTAAAPTYKASVKCYKPDGTFTGREITDVVDPRALAYDGSKDQLLVAENGLDLNIRIYAGLAKNPSLAKTFGEKGGIFSGKNPGLVHDPDAGGYARFPRLSGVGVDKQGNIYVGGGFQGSDVRAFTPEGKLLWMVNSLVFCNTYDVDPDSDGAQIYAPFSHLELDLSKTDPGSEQKYVSYNWNPRRFGELLHPGNVQAMVRRLGSERRLVLFTSGQGTVGDINIYRYDGEIAVPSGGMRDHGKSLWIDANGDGKEEPRETVKMATQIGKSTGYCVDSKGDLWVATSDNDFSKIRHFRFKGLNPKGVPLYSGAAGEGYTDLKFPEEGGKTRAWSMDSRLDYDADRDVLVALFPAVARAGEGDKSPPQYFLARYDNWSKGNRKPTWKIKAYRPETNPDYFMYEKNLFRYSFYSNMQIVGDYVFMAFLFGEVHAFDLATGKLVEIFAAGPEVNGRCAWEDAAMGLRAFKRKNGEYLIFTENSGWGGKNHLFRWKPE